MELFRLLNTFCTERLPGVLIAKILDENKAGQWSEGSKRDKQEEIRGLLKRRAFTKAHKCDLFQNGNKISGWFVLAIKNVSVFDEALKTHSVVQGLDDRDKNMLLLVSVYIGQHKIRIIIGIASISD